MEDIIAIGFDLFNTLITADHDAIKGATQRLSLSLEKSGFDLEPKAFKRAHRESAVRFIKETRQEGKETHNRFWISEALGTQGHTVSPDDPRVAKAVDAYFSAFFDHCHPIPGTVEMLEKLSGRYRLGLLSNFTHGPAARGIIEYMGFAPFFEVILISGELGYCKPHPMVFHKLAEALGVQKNALIYIGDDPLLDIEGAQEVGIQPVWTTYVRDRDIPYTPGIARGQTKDPEDTVSRISTWDEFLSLLDGKKKRD